MPYTVVPCSLGKLETGCISMSNRYYCTSQHRIFFGSSKAVTVAVVTAGHVECRLGDGPGNGGWARVELWGAGPG